MDSCSDCGIELGRTEGEYINDVLYCKSCADEIYVEYIDDRYSDWGGTGGYNDQAGNHF